MLEYWKTVTIIRDNTSLFKIPIKYQKKKKKNINSYPVSPWPPLSHVLRQYMWCAPHWHGQVQGHLRQPRAIARPELTRLHSSLYVHNLDWPEFEPNSHIRDWRLFWFRFGIFQLIWSHLHFGNFLSFRPITINQSNPTQLKLSSSIYEEYCIDHYLHKVISSLDF
jgi:hypothetical protein